MTPFRQGGPGPFQQLGVGQVLAALLEHGASVRRGHPVGPIGLAGRDLQGPRLAFALAGQPLLVFLAFHLQAQSLFLGALEFQQPFLLEECLLLGLAFGLEFGLLGGQPFGFEPVCLGLLGGTPALDLRLPFGLGAFGGGFPLGLGLLLGAALAFRLAVCLLPFVGSLHGARRLVDGLGDLVPVGLAEGIEPVVEGLEGTLGLLGVGVPQARLVRGGLPRGFRGGFCGTLGTLGAVSGAIGA
ncbi:hypothetical protein ACFFX0_29850 [Citricoccus parietis]|uniref:Uncharacterized protein n=1 Tax=Citricoccus parietis TaxID=592307 RepID=A0ABV5G869_9MICC